MTDYFVDSANGDDTDDGTTMDAGGGGGNPGAWATITHATAVSGLSPGDRVWVRRTHVEFAAPAGSHISFSTDGTVENPISVFGWPRAEEAAITEADWTNGSTTVDTIVGLSMDREQHLGRYITGPDGYNYLITFITDSDTILIDREYAGATVTSTDGAAPILADEDYDLAQAIDVAFATEKVAWTADADDLCLIDFGGATKAISFSGAHCVQWKNFDIQNADYGSGSFYIYQSTALFIQGCLSIKLVNSATLGITGKAGLYIDRCIFVGAGAGSANQGLAGNYDASARITNSAFYNFGDIGIYGSGGVYIELYNVNVGVEQANGDEDIGLGYSGRIYGVDVRLGGGVGPWTVVSGPSPYFIEVGIENYQKVFGTHIRFGAFGSVTKLDVVTGSGDPYKRTGGADSVLEVLCNITAVKSPVQRWAAKIFEHEFEATTDSKNYRYYVNAEEAVAADRLWIEVEYVSTYDDASEYVSKRVVSTESISQQADNEDWSQYIEVTGITPAVASKVRIKCYCGYYHATGKIYIDPKVVITDG